MSHTKCKQGKQVNFQLILPLVKNELLKLGLGGFFTIFNIKIEKKLKNQQKISKKFTLALRTPLSKKVSKNDDYYFTVMFNYRLCTVGTTSEMTPQSIKCYWNVVCNHAREPSSFIAARADVAACALACVRLFWLREVCLEWHCRARAGFFSRASTTESVN